MARAPRSAATSASCSNGRRTATTSSPRASRSATTCRPMKPDAPVTATLNSQLSTINSQRLFVDSVRLIEPSAAELGRLIDVAVVLEHPRELDALVLTAFHLCLERRQQQRIEPECTIARVDTEQEQPDLIDVPLSQEQSRDREREEPSARALQRLVDIGDRHRTGDRLAVHFGAYGAARVEDRLQLGRQPSELVRS